MAVAPPYLIIGRIVRPHGVRGELVVAPDTDFPDRILLLKEALFSHGSALTPVLVETVRRHGDQFLLKVKDVDSPEAAARWRGAALAVRLEHAAPLAQGQYYVFEVLGLRVETEAGESLGIVAEIIRTGSNDVYVVRGPRGDILVPAIASVVTSIDVAARRIRIRPLAGMEAGS